MDTEILSYCHTSTHHRYEAGFGGGKSGRLVDAKCLSGYVFFGVTCSRPFDTAAKMTNPEATTECGKRGDMLYFPPIKMQGWIPQSS